MRGLLRALTDGLAESATRIAIGGMLAMLAVLIALGGIVTLFIALYLALAEHFARAEAALFTAGAAFIVCVILFVVLRASSRPRAQATKRDHDDSTDSLESILAGAMELGDGLQDLIRNNKREAAVGAFVLGMVCGISPGIREKIWDLAHAVVQRESKEKEREKT